MIGAVPIARPKPWRAVDLFVTGFAVGGGAMLLGFAWWRASGTPDEASQILWIKVAIVGLIVAASGNLLWILNGRREIGLRRLRLFPEETLDSDAPAEAVSARLVSAPRLTRYHLDTCPMVAGKRTRAASETRHRAAGREPCGVCRADE